MQPYFAPYIGYFALMAAVDTFVLYGRVQHQRKSWFTRNRMIIAGKPRWISPILFKSRTEALISEVRVDPEQPWRTRLAAQIRHSYRRALYFEETWPLVERILACKDTTLDEFNRYGIVEIAQHLGLGTRVLSSADIPASIEDELRTEADDDHRRNTRVGLIASALKAKAYVNPVSGRGLYSADRLAGHDLELWFLEPDIPAIGRMLVQSKPSLSVLHLLMHHGRKSVVEALSHIHLNLDAVGL